jgi:hypothetical protein
MELRDEAKEDAKQATHADCCYSHSCEGSEDHGHAEDSEVGSGGGILSGKSNLSRKAT